jgi:anti-sigma factor RsiW
VVEEDLIDAYLRGELTPERRQRFERYYLTTEARQERVIMAAALLRHIDEYNAASKPAVAAPPTRLTAAERFRAFWNSQTWALRAAASIVVVAVIAGALWLLLFRAPSPRTFATLTLAISNINRAEGAQADKVKLPPDAEALKVSLTLPRQSPPAARYRVELEDDNGETRSVEVVGNDAQSVLVVIPAAQLARGQYALKLFAVKTDGEEQRINGSYFFNVE